ncbi:hypothetical protein PIB30_083055 [Stylosanthes scabra]|uniref:Ubiquitin-like protease family profile domain-containing protein n=1 Tax=Stylosanthes scabra TaxID=79078 RepID=A0ABU6UUH2_9FABA|nr:hypothetical protein [Stylosanthes scabra]
MEGKSFKTLKRKSFKENPSHCKSFTIDEEGGAEYDGRFSKVLHTIQMKLLTREDMVMFVVKNQGQQIQTLTDVVAQYGEVLQTLMSSGFVEGPSSKKQETTNRVEGGSTKTALKATRVGFALGLDMSEILIPDSLARETREMLWSLCPGKELFDDILNLLVMMQTAAKETTKWWLPTTFSAKYLDGFLTADRFYEKDLSIRPRVSEFEFLEPRIGQQKELSENKHDCGIWVCLWMIESHQSIDFGIDVDDSTRMTIALNLVTYSHNPIRDFISERAVHF